MVIITSGYKPYRVFDGEKFSLEKIGDKTIVDERRKQLKSHRLKTRILKGKKVGYTSQQYLLYASG